jgi:hypothetical protein
MSGDGERADPESVSDAPEGGGIAPPNRFRDRGKPSGLAADCRFTALDAANVNAWMARQLSTETRDLPSSADSARPATFNVVPVDGEGVREVLVAGDRCAYVDKQELPTPMTAGRWPPLPATSGWCIRSTIVSVQVDWSATSRSRPGIASLIRSENR